jgi:ketohexokinase
VNTHHCVFREDHDEPASSYIIHAEDQRTRTIVNYNTLPEMTSRELHQRIESIHPHHPDSTPPHDPPNDPEATADLWVHFEGRECEVGLECIRWLRHRHDRVIISVEAEKPQRPGLHAMAAAADVVFFSKTWALAEGFADLREFLTAQAHLATTAALLFCTWGSEGAAVLRTTDGRFWHEPADEGGVVVDPVGAGDTFTAGALWGLYLRGRGGLEGDAAHDALVLGTRLASRKVQQRAFAGLVDASGQS